MWDTDSESSNDAEPFPFDTIQQLKSGSVVKPQDDRSSVGAITKFQILELYTLNTVYQRKEKVKDYKFVKAIDISLAKFSYFITRNRILLLLDDIYDVETIFSGSYGLSTSIVLEVFASSIGPLEEACSFIDKVMVRGPEALSLGSNVVYDAAYGCMKIQNIMLEDFGFPMDRIEDLKVKLRDSDDVSVRGRQSGFMERSLKGEANQPTYIQIITRKDKLEATKNFCISTINDLIGETIERTY